MKKNDYGVWEITLPAVKGKTAIEHGSKVKVSCLSSSTGFPLLPLPPMFREYMCSHAVRMM